MRTYLIRRILIMIPVFLGILFLLFSIANLAPGGPLEAIQDPSFTPEMKAELAARMGLDQPLLVRFWNWMKEAVRGNFGTSYRYKEAVSTVIGRFMGKTINLAVFALTFSVLVGVPVGIISATRQYSITDNVLTVFSLIGISIPSFFFGLILLKIFAIDHQIFPLFGIADPLMRNPTTWQFLVDRVYHLVLPTLVLGLSSMASFMRYTRSSMLEVVRQDYIRTARAKGLTERVVIYRHAFRNAVIPIITLLGFQIPGLISGAVITETIFALPGIGKLQIDAVLQRDYPLFMGINAMTAFLTLLGTLIADILYAVADPRIKYD